MSVTFTRTNLGTYDPATDTYTGGSVTTITGQAIGVRGNPIRYQALGLKLDTMPTLEFTPDAYPLRAGTAEFVLPGDVVTWNGIDMVVKAVDCVAPDGSVILAKIVVSP